MQQTVTRSHMAQILNRLSLSIQSALQRATEIEMRRRNVATANDRNLSFVKTDQWRTIKATTTSVGRDKDSYWIDKIDRHMRYYHFDMI
jgi:hypothetical protein